VGLVNWPLLESFASVRYWLFRGDYLKMPPLAMGYTEVGRAGDITVLENRNFIPLGFVLDRVLEERVFRKLSPAARSIAAVNAVVVPDAAAYASFATWDSASAPTPYTYDALVADARRCAGRAMTDVVVGPNRVAGRLSTGPGELVLSIPFDPGWSATVDGRAAPLARIDLGMTGLRVGAGEHAIRLTYRSPLRDVGAITSCLGWASLGVVILASRRRKKGARAAPDGLD